MFCNLATLAEGYLYAQRQITPSNMRGVTGLLPLNFTFSHMSERQLLNYIGKLKGIHSKPSLGLRTATL